MIKGRDILIVCQQAWDIEIGSNCKNIAIEFSKHNRVLYVNPALDRITMIRHRSDKKIKRRLNVINKKEAGLIKISENIWNLYPDKLLESINWLRSEWLFKLFNKRNNKVFAEVIKRALTALDFKDTIIFNDGDMFRSLYLKELLRPSFSIYYYRDNYLATDYYRRHGKISQPLVIKKSDLCLTNSDYLADYCKKYNSNSFNIGQGCDVASFINFSSPHLPADIAVIPKPVIGYVGALLTSRLDIEILLHIARYNPDWNIVLIGPEDDSFVSSELHLLKNVHFLGAKHGDDLAAYISAFDICINPQVINELTVGNYPRKIDEYLAMGKPVVATKTLAMDMFKTYAYTANSKEQYLTLIKRALEEDSPEAHADRIRFASMHTWTNHVNAIYNAITRTLSSRYKAPHQLQLFDNPITA
ncbi:glycosyltransferase [Mucilaginibacter ginkgonis]|uniref:Glycosyltransferase n=1 Tax=Mucilaginibacter ginkgonis TaxID=2682091 RepID=A0A6I4IMY1_9SPHI|nr:glycosyltransferase [Mucilaginibacter ginkgonis]QQL51237.1 glycosyltransferase [Mucilaginibacter ginkgonis]